MRTKTFHSLLVAAGMVAFTATTLRAQVGINNTATSPNASAILDLNSGNSGANKGFLPPQVALTSVSVAAPVTSPATGLIVYSTSAPTGGNGAGYYYWNGTAWTSLGSSVSTLSGSGTADYVAVWTGASSLGTGLTQDNGTGVGINNAPVAGNELYVNSTTGTGVLGLGEDTGVSGYGVAASAGIGISAASPANDGIFANGYWGGIYGGGNYVYGVWGQDAMGDNAQLAWSDGGTYGYGVNATGVNYGVYAYATDAGEVDAGVYGEDDNNVGVYGYSSGYMGVEGYGAEYGGYFYDEDGDYADIGDINGNYGGSGVNVYGVEQGGFFEDGAGDFSYIALASSWDAGGYFQDADGDYVYDAYDGYSNLGSGPKNTIIKDASGQYRAMSCPEAPEVLFEDYGTSKLVNGKVHVDLDKLYASSVAINDKHPLRVMVTLNDECNGVFVTNRTTTGFDVVELNHGASNASFTYEVIANRANTTTYKGVPRNYADVRYAPAPGPMTVKTAQVKVRTPQRHGATNNMSSLRTAPNKVSLPVKPAGKN